MKERCDTVHYAVEAQVERTPDTVAVEFEGQELTFAELESLSNKVAHHLCAFGAGFTCDHQPGEGDINWTQ